MRERLAALLLEVDGTSGGYGGGDGWMRVEICLNILYMDVEPKIGVVVFTPQNGW